MSYKVRILSCHDLPAGIAQTLGIHSPSAGLLCQRAVYPALCLDVPGPSRVDSGAPLANDWYGLWFKKT